MALLTPMRVVSRYGHRTHNAGVAGSGSDLLMGTGPTAYQLFSPCRKAVYRSLCRAHAGARMTNAATPPASCARLANQAGAVVVHCPRRRRSYSRGTTLGLTISPRLDSLHRRQRAFMHVGGSQGLLCGHGRRSPSPGRHGLSWLHRLFRRGTTDGLRRQAPRQVLRSRTFIRVVQPPHGRGSLPPRRDAHTSISPRHGHRRC